MSNPSTRYIVDKFPDPSYGPALQNFYTVANANASTLGLTAGNLTEIQNALNAWTTIYNQLVAAQDTAKSIRTGKEAQLKATRAIISKWAKTFRANPAVSDQLLGQLQLAPHHPDKTITPPAQPTSLTAKADSLGTVTLRWHRNGNIANTVFVLESRTSNTAEWTQVSTTTKASLVTEATVGQYVAYRVTAFRNSQFSQPSQPVVLWDNGGQQTMLKVA